MRKNIEDKTDEQRMEERIKKQYVFDKNPRRDMRAINRGVNNIIRTNNYLSKILKIDYRKLLQPFGTYFSHT